MLLQGQKEPEGLLVAVFILRTFRPLNRRYFQLLAQRDDLEVGTWYSLVPSARPFGTV
jgi:hypothetical protein